MAPMHSIIDSHLQQIEQKGRLRSITCTDQPGNGYVIRNGQKLLSFSSNDYLGLSQHPNVKEAAIRAIEQYGTGSGASRLITGNNPLYDTLEKTLAATKGSEDCIVFGSGYLANIGTIAALMKKTDLILADKLAHACLLDGARLSGATLLRFSHNDAAKCTSLLKKHRNHHTNCLIVTETVFSMDGDLAPVQELHELATQHDTWLLTDDAHGLGVVTTTTKSHLQMGTLSKAVGSYGGYVCTSKATADYLRNTARSLIYSTALPPATLAASIAALELMQSDTSLAARALENARHFTALLNLPQAQSPIVPLVLGGEEKTLLASKTLEQAGFLAWPIRPPTVPSGTSRLRFTFSALHKTQDIETLADIIKREGLL